jgi:hypothetical protein
MSKLRCLHDGPWFFVADIEKSVQSAATHDRKVTGMSCLMENWYGRTATFLCAKLSKMTGLVIRMPTLRGGQLRF